MATPHRSPFPSTSAEPAPGFTGPLQRVHGALNQREVWQALRLAAHEIAPADSLTLEIGRSPEGVPRRVYRHAHPATPAEWRREHPANAWLLNHPGAPAYRLSDLVSPRDLRRSLFHEAVMRREGWDKLLAIVAWDGREAYGVLNLHRAPAAPDFTAKELRAAEAFQPHLQVALMRVRAHEKATHLGAHFASMLEAVPVGLLLLDWELQPLWHNNEAAQACAVWNHGERRAAALRPQRAFRVPAALLEACAGLRTEWQTGDAAAAGRQKVLSEDALGLHAQITARALPDNPVALPAFEIQLDYRRPRGDRNRPLSPGAVALLARLSAREREVAMRVREGLRTSEIAAELRRSPLTIKTQLAAIFTKLEVRTRTRVAALLNR